MAYRHTNSKGLTLYLHRIAVTLRDGRHENVYFFSKRERHAHGVPCDLPASQVVAENPRLGSLGIFRKARYTDDLPAPVSAIAGLVRRFAEKLAHAVAEDPAALDELEWREMERMMAAVLDCLGFDAELTPGSKDGGKDIIVRLTTESGFATYIIELKHWRSGKRVGPETVREFVSVVARESRDGGLFLSTYGYTKNAFQTLTEIERRTVRFGGKSKIVSLCRYYVQIGHGLLQPEEVRPEDLLLSETIEV